MLDLLWKTLLFICLVVTGGACQQVPMAPQTASITIASTAKQQRFEQALFGTNIQWEWAGDGILNLNTKASPRFKTSAINLAKKIKLGSIRFPGGSLSDTYQWKDGIGKPALRKAGITFSGGKGASHFGSDELLALCETLNTEPLLTMNFNWPIDYGLEWVQYVESALKGKNVQAQYWEIGNEIYSPHEVGHTSAKKYALRANQFAKAIKAHNNKLQVGVALEVSFLQAAWMKNIYPHMLTWNDEVLANISKDIDFVSLHFYAPFDKLFNSSKLSELVLSGPEVFAQNIAMIKALLKRHNRMDLKFAITEYNTFFGDKSKLDTRTAEPEGALFSALMLFKMANEPNIVLANHWSLINNAVFGLIETNEQGQSQPRPSHTVFEELSKQVGNFLVDNTVISPVYQVEAKGNIPSMNKVNMLATLVTENKSGSRFINMVNRSSDTALQLRIDTKKKTYAVHSWQQWSGRTRADWQRKQQAFSGKQVAQQTKMTLPPHSFTVMELEPLAMAKSKLNE